MNLDINILKQEFEDLKYLYLLSKPKYLHIKSVDHFLFQFESLTNEEDKIIVYYNLSAFIKDAKESIIYNGSDSYHLYKRYLEEVAKLYRNKLSFSIAILPSYIFLITIIFTILIWALHASLYFYFGLLVFDFTLLLRNYILDKQKKSFCLYY
jgi:hypothetical protein